MRPEPYPLHWPEGVKRTTYPARSRFRTTGVGRARDELFRELKRLGAAQVVLSSNLRLRLDGLPYADAANPLDPGVAVYFMRRSKPIVIACDGFRNVCDNMRAIAKTIEAMRSIERYGSSQLAEQTFSAFHALPPSGGVQHRAKPWREVLGVPAGLDRADALILAEAKYRKAIAATHPDRGGDPEVAAELNGAIARAREELR